MTREVPEGFPRLKQPRLSKAKRTYRNRKRINYERLRRDVESRANGRCEARIDGVCLGRGDAAHHIQPRSAGGKDDLGNLLWICNSGCHAWIHRNPTAAKELGFLRGRYNSEVAGG